VASSTEIIGLARESLADLVAIDEAQFFDEHLPQVVLYLVEEAGIPVAFTALNKDFRGEPFGPVPKLMAISTELVMITSRCTYSNGGKRKCGAEAKHTQRLINGQPAPYDSPIVVIEKQGEGNVVTYEARCPDHWYVPNMPKRLDLDKLGR
jgi:thymidine kinase